MLLSYRTLFALIRCCRLLVPEPAMLIPHAVLICVWQVTKDPKSIRRPKRETALTRHRKWLAELQKVASYTPTHN